MAIILRTVRNVSLLLLAGAVATVAVSWSVSLWGPSPGMLQRGLAKQPRWPGEVPPNWPPEPRSSESKWGDGLGWRAVEFITWTKEETAGYAAEASYVRIEVGFPWRAFAHEHLTEGPGIVTKPTPGLRKQGYTFFELPIWRSGFRIERVTPYRWVPLLAVWPGFLLNTLTYAAVFSALFLGPRYVSRALRKRAGRCPSCGYDLRSTPDGACPECGLLHHTGVTASSPARPGS